MAMEKKSSHTIVTTLIHSSPPPPTLCIPSQMTFENRMKYLSNIY